MIKNIYTPNTPVMRALSAIGPFCGEQQVVPEPVIVIEDNDVSMSCAYEGADIYYTIDGTTTPTTESYKYTSEIEITEDTTFMAIAVMSGYGNSRVVTFNAEYAE